MRRATSVGSGPARSAQDATIVLAALTALLAADLPSVGADGWTFAAGHVHPQGSLAWLVELARGRWDVNLLRTTVVATMALVTLGGLLVLRGWRPGRRTLVVVTMAAVACVLLPPVLLQMGLRQSTAPWFYTNDSTYQIELAGNVARHGESPYGHDYRYTGMERFYTMDGHRSPRTDRMVALRHFPYFPGSAAAAAVWDELPAPWRDYRLFVALCTLLLVPAALLFAGPLGCRLAVGAALACNPVALRLAWFGNADAPCVLAIVTAFGLASRGRYRSAGAALAVAVLFKQFALAAVPALLVLIAVRASRRHAGAAAATGAAVLAAAFLPFLLASPASCLERHGRLRHRQLPHRQLRHVGRAGPVRRGRAPLRRLPGADADAAGVGAGDRLRRTPAVALTGGLGGRRIVHGLGVRAADGRPRLPGELHPLPALRRDAVDAARAGAAGDLGAGGTAPLADRARARSSGRTGRPAGGALAGELKSA